MRIQFERAGGFAPSAMKLSYAFNSDELPDEEADELQTLIKSADITGIADRRVAQRPRPDAFYYRMVIDDEDGTHTVVTSDSDMPASLRPLITWLVKQAKHGR